MKTERYARMAGGLSLIVGVVVSAAWAAAPDARSVRVTVTVTGPASQIAPQITRRDVEVFENGQRRPITDLTPVNQSPNGSDLAILVDGSLSSNVALQFDDLRNFIRGLPPLTRVGVAYAEYGSARFSQTFTGDREKAGNALRLPEGKVNTGASIYQSVADLARHWPEDGRARSVLLVSDGLDINRGLGETLPTLNPDLNDAIAQAQKAGVSVYAIYSSGASLLTRDLFLLNNGQSSLARLAAETGGQAYFQGDETPVSFRPFLSELRDTLSRQYLLTFEAEPNSGEANLRVATELPHVRLSAPARVWTER